MRKTRKQLKAKINELVARINELNAEVRDLRDRPTIARLPSGDAEVFTVRVTEVFGNRDLVEVYGIDGRIQHIPGSVTVSMVCVGPQPPFQPDLLAELRFALVPVEPQQR